MDKEQAMMEATNFWEDPQALGESVNLLSYATVFVKRWPFLVLTSFAGFAIALAIAFSLTPQFTSRAVFLPPSQQTSALDNPLSLILRPPSSSIYTGLLGSESVVTYVIQSSDLQNRYKTKDIEQTRQVLRAGTSISADAAGFVTLQVTDKDPKLAQHIAGDYLTALSRLNDRLAISEAAQHRLLFQSEFERAKNDLEKAEVELKQAQEASGVVSPETQIKSGLSAIEIARTDIRARQVALASLLKSETEQAPEVQRLRSEIATEQGQLASLESKAATGPGSGISAGEAPSVSLRFVQLEREVKYNQVIFDVMAKQYESARLQESSAAPGVQVVDFPEVPLHKSKPARTIIALAGLALGFVFGLATIFLRNRLQVLAQHPVESQALENLRHAFLRGKFTP